MPSKDLTNGTLVSEDHDGPDNMTKMKMKMIKFDDDIGISCDESYHFSKCHLPLSLPYNF